MMTPEQQHSLTRACVSAEKVNNALGRVRSLLKRLAIDPSAGTERIAEAVAEAGEFLTEARNALADLGRHDA